MFNIEEQLVKNFKEDIIEIKSPRPRRIFVRVKPNAAKEAFKFLAGKLGIEHLTAITALDLKMEFEVVYHLFGQQTLVSLGFKVNHDDPKIQTVTDVIPGAVLYEREIQDLFGIKVVGIPDDRKLILSDNWPEGHYPLRKDWNKDKLPAEWNQGLRRDWRT